MKEQIRYNRAVIFDAVRKLLGRGFRQAEVEMLDDAVKAAMQPSADQQPGSAEQSQSGALPAAIGPAGVALIKRFEGCARLRPDGNIEAYPDPGTGGDPWTIGWGATGMGLDGKRIGPGTVWTKAECDARLERDLIRYAGDVARALGEAPRTQAQFDAMVSFHYNTGAIARATLTKRHIARDYTGAAREFARWNKAGGRVLNGLVRRRTAERDIYEGVSSAQRR